MESWTSKNTITVSWRRKLIVKKCHFLYTRMMNKYHTTLTVLGMLAALAPHAHAYVTPEQVLRQNEYEDFIPSYEDSYDTYEEDHEAATEPSGIRYSKGTPIYRVQQSKGPHMTLKKYAPVAEEEEPLIDESVGLDTEEEESTNITLQLDAKTLRLLERLTSPKSANVLSPTAHSGAPLAPTGPATVIAMGVMGVAIYATMRRARRMGARG